MTLQPSRPNGKCPPDCAYQGRIASLRARAEEKGEASRGLVPAVLTAGTSPAARPTHSRRSEVRILTVAVPPDSFLSAAVRLSRWARWLLM